MLTTPIEYVDGIYVKREDKFEFNGLRGAKVRSALYLINKAIDLGYKKITTVGHRKSPQIQIVGEICKHFDLEFVGHTPQGELPEAFSNYNIIQHKAGYNNVIAARCHQYTLDHKDFYEIPFGMISRESILLTADEVFNIPLNSKRIVIPVGSGVNLCGVLLGFRKYKINIPITGVVVGMSPIPLLNKFAPFGWQNKVELVDAQVPYAKQIDNCIFNGIELDPVYEAKCVPFIKKGDLFWIIGIRNFKI